ncbi:MAG: hypothetical protein ACI3ZD_17570 [Prevotella sp.]
MERIDFYRKKKDLHNEILQAIVEVFAQSNITEIDVSEDKFRTWVVISPDGASSTHEVEVRKIRCKHGHVSIQIEDYDDWIGCEFAGIVLTNTIDNLYDTAYEHIIE